MTPERSDVGPEPTALPSGLDPMGAVPRQRRDDVELVPEPGELLDDPRHHGARGGGVGFEVRTQDDDLHDLTDP
jgi:hypothetical protein